MIFRKYERSMYRDRYVFIDPTACIGCMLDFNKPPPVAISIISWCFSEYLCIVLSCITITVICNTPIIFILLHSGNVIE